jgi:TorA maturation chaperone TorD
MGQLVADGGAEVSHAAVQPALERAQAWRAMGRAFAAPRDTAQLHGDLVALQGRASGALEIALAGAIAALGSERAEVLGDAHEQLFGGRGGGVPARESAYADARVVAPAELADVRGFLRAFGLEEKGELADHVATECELASALALKEAWAYTQGWHERAEIARGAYESFLADHLLRWIPRFAACVRAAEAPAFYVAAADAVAALLADEGRRLGLSSLHDLEAQPLPSPPDEIACGGCASDDASPLL